MRLIHKQLGLLSLLSLLIVGLTSCDKAKDLAGNVAEECGLGCPGDSVDGVKITGLVDGNASISGIRSVDAFFGAVLNFKGAADSLTKDVNTEMGKIAVSVGLMPGATSAEIKAKIKAKIDANVDGGLTVNFKEPKCEASASVVVEASARCDVDVNPGKAEVKCMGTCEVEASVAADCDAKAEVVCTGTAPALACQGSCKGECQFDASASCKGSCMGGCQGTCTVKSSAACTGTCNGKCSGTCSAMSADGVNCAGKCTGGTCEGSCEIDGSVECKGSCSGMCMADCQADAKGSCSGSCKGECEYTPPMAMCSADASVKCRATATAMATCKGKCEGTIEPPSAKAECEASARAEANAKVECTPPSLDVQFKLKATIAGDAIASASFEAWLEGFKGHLSAILALEAKGNSVFNAGGELVSAADGAVKGAINDIQADGSLKLRATFGAGCALGQLPKVKTIIDDATTEMMASVSAIADITAGAGIGG